MTEDAKQEEKKIEVGESFLKALLKQLNDLQKQVDDQGKLTRHVETSMDRFLRKQTDELKSPLKEKKEAPILLVDEPPTVEAPYKHNECPYCNMLGKTSIIDLTKSAKWACRRCGKHWYNWALGKKYSMDLERGEQEKVEKEEIRQHELSMAKAGVR